MKRILHNTLYHALFKYTCRYKYARLRFFFPKIKIKYVCISKQLALLFLHVELCTRVTLQPLLISFQIIRFSKNKETNIASLITRYTSFIDYPELRGPACFDCQQTRNPKLCRSIAVCKQGEVNVYINS